VQTQQRASRRALASEVHDGADWRIGIVIQAHQYESTIRRRLTRYTRNAADTEELVQETYVRLLSMNAENMPEPEHLLGYVMVVARNIACDWLRRRSVVSVHFSDGLPVEVAEDSEPDEMLSVEQELDSLAEIVESMPGRRRQVFTLRKVYGFSQKEIARLMGISVNTVEQHLTRAVRAIVDDLGLRTHSFSALRHARSLGARSRMGSSADSARKTVVKVPTAA
jgi:RNA polymerase sigma factor (sigma-70 family)